MFSMFSFIFFYLFFLVFFSNFFFFDPEFFLSFSAFLIFFVVFAIFNSYSDLLITEKYNSYKSSLLTLNDLLFAADEYTTSLVVYVEDLFEAIMLFSIYEAEIDNSENNNNSFSFLIELNISISKILFELLKIENTERTDVLIFSLNETVNTFLRDFDFDGYRYTKRSALEPNIWFYEPRSLRQIYVARPVKPGDYIIPDWAYIDL